jgi:hypothetical protein
MHPIFRRHSSFLFLLPLVAFLTATEARAVDPLWDHYKVYRDAGPQLASGKMVVLTDQFGVSTHFVQTMDFFMNPVAKFVPATGNDYPIHDDITHYTWWHIPFVPIDRTVLVDNQFGTQSLHVTAALYLLNPALKNQSGALPVRNHYKCYQCDGQSVSIPVRLTDQFDIWQTTAMIPRLLCNPARKELPNDPPPNVYDIVDSRQHYVCYEIQPQDPGTFSAAVSDQFVENVPQNFNPGVYLCVPSDKTEPTGAVKDTWGRVKMLYR